jgi:very-short-patch-repair endonuclease
MRSTAIDEAILAIARRQHGALSREQAFAAGASSRFIDRRLAAGDWYRLDTGVYALPAFPPTYLRQYKAAELSVRDSAIAGLAAGALLELTGYRVVWPELVVPPTARRKAKLATIHRYAGAKLTTVKGIRVTSEAQTLCDTVLRVDLWTYERAMDDAILAGRLRFDRQVRLRWRSGAEHRVDFVCVERRLIIEVDGRRWHTRVQDFDNDLWRTNEAVAHGYRVLRFTWVHLTTAPQAVVAMIEHAIAPAA